MTPLSLCMIVKNEASNLNVCLRSVQNLAPEMIVVDTGSTDGTLEVAAEWGARVIPFDFTFADFSAARNAALKQATGRWILVLDADETLAPESLPAVQEITQSHDNVGYFLERHNYAADSTTSTTDHVVRLFPNRPEFRYYGRVHETVDASILAAGGRLLESKMGIYHHFITSREARRAKNHWYIQILKEELAAHPLDDSRLDFLAAEYHQLEMFDEATAIAEQIARRRPTDARAHLFAGTYHLLFKPDFQQARLDFERALALRPGYPEAASFLRLLDSKEGSIC